MPIYEYRCRACGHHLEALQKMTEAPLRKCPECGKSQLKRLVSASQFRLKGSGWYETDFKNKNETKRNLVERGGAEPSESSSDKSTDTAAKAEAGKAVAEAKADSTPAKPEKPKAKPTATRSKSAAKSRAKTARR
ncbi:MAG TPA: FmdB family zinc ribbon protein [Gammaproteobacteria bacterium]|nr:FmdB family zinc ribbon protein [Gammaproteobacteria bacterium]